MKNKIYLIILGLALSIGAIQADVAVTLNLATAGTLSSLINSSKKNLITSLTLTGNLNGTDIRYIREMAGSDVNGNATLGTLSVLDLTGANIVSGGNYYYTTYNTTANAISTYMFYGCTGLTSITIPNSVTSIGSSAFSGCTGLTSITIPNSVTSIGSGAFLGCTGLTSVTIPNSVTSIGGGAFSGCTGLIQIIVDSNNSKYTSLDGVLFNENRTSLIAYPNEKSTQYTIPNSVTSIGSSAFSGCTGLTSVTIPNSVTSIGQNAFSGCTGLTSITIPNSVTSIGYNAFFGCTGLTSVTIPNSVTSIGGGAFSGCTGLTSITIPNSVTSIGSGAFSGCTGLTSITIPNSVTSIGSGAFSGCTGLTSVTIPNSVTSIGGGAFSGCTGLTSITIPNSVTSIGSGAFSGCTGLTSVTIDNNYVTAAVSSVFSTCTNLTTVTIGNNVTSIGSSAFYGFTGLTSVTIPNSVTSIGQNAFSGCTGLTEFHCQMKTPPSITSDVFTNVNKSTCKLYVPKGSYSPYWVANVWGDFTNIIEEDVTPVNEIKTINATVYAEQNNIVVKGASVGETISVYTTMGTLVKTIKATNDIRINVPSNQIYLVKIADRTFKVAL